MNNSNRLIDLYMQKLSLHTLNEVATKLGVTRPAVSNWRAGTSHPNAAAIEAMCKATSEPVQRWLPLIEADRCRTDSDRKVWLRLAQAAAAIALMVCLHKSDGHKYIAMLFATHNSGTLYIMSN
jgi:transcriptional regulator with XRE-family HTH domain